MNRLLQGDVGSGKNRCCSGQFINGHAFRLSDRINGTY